MRALRDELDCARERATRAEQLQSEVQNCKHRLRSLELTRTQLKVHTVSTHESLRMCLSKSLLKSHAMK